MKKKRFFCCLTALALVVGATACTKSQPGQTARSVTVKGSDTMLHLVSPWAERFMGQQPGVSVSVTGGGSGTGIAALVNGTTDICMASREMNDDEKKQVQQRGTAPQETVVANDGIAIVVNPQNPLNDITTEQLAKVFTGAYAKWSELGGAEAPIVVFSRESSSGTYVFFQEHVLKKKDYTSSARLLPATSGIVQAVSTDAGAIGYVGLGYAQEAQWQIKVLGVKAYDTAPSVMPSEETVRSGAYPIARPLYFYTMGAPEGSAKTFVDFCLSPAGQAVVRECGYVPAQ